MSTTSRPGVAHETAVDAVRRFNRFYTRQLGLLDERHLQSGRSLTEVRVLYELAHGRDVAASDLAQRLGIDAGYLSRLLKRLSTRGLLRRAASDVDGRRAVLSLTAAGRKAFAPIEAATIDQVSGLLDGLSVAGRDDVLRAMATIRRLLGDEGDATSSSPATTTLRDPRPGDIGHVISRQGALYAQEFGWDATFEGLVAEIAGRFVQRFDPAAESCWIAEHDGATVGSVFLVRKSPRVAQLRLLYVEPSARGLGIGRALVDACVGFARAAGYRQVTLWTNDVLRSARKIYRAAGFVLVDEAPHRSFGKDLVGQHWTLTLRPR